MKSNFLKSLTNNIGYKILAVLFAFTLWVIVYNIDDPPKTNTLTLNVAVTNTNYLVNMDKYYEIIDGTNRISISVTAPRSMWEDLDETDFTAVANFNNIDIDEEGTEGTVPIEIACKKTSDSIKINTTSRVCKVSLENLMSKQFVIAANTVGTVSEGHALGDVKVTNPTVLKVSGPESIIKSISQVVATIDVEDMSMNLTDNVVPVLLDEKGDEINTTRLTLSNPTVMVSAEILKTKSIPVFAEIKGSPGNGYVVTSIKINPEKVEIKGSSSVLNMISALEIPSELLDVSGKKEDVVFTIDVSDLLENGTELVDNSQVNVDVSVTIEALKSRNFNLKTQEITVNGLPETLELKYVNAAETVTINGLKADLDLLTEDAMSASIDVNGLAAGTHKVVLHVYVDDSKYSYLEKTISVVISEIVTDTEETEATEPSEIEELQ